jgi:plastocyanin
MHVARNNQRRRRLETVASIGLALVLAPVWAWAADGKGREAAAGPSAADFAKLQREVAEQRQLIIQMLQMEQQRYDFLLRLLQSGGQSAPGAMLPPVPTLPGLGATPESPRGPAASKSPAEHAAAADHAAGPASVTATATATVTGHITARTGTVKDTYVYLDQVRGSPARGHTLEIKQKDKQFWPEVAAVQRGTTVTFPNFDAVFHNVFSPSGKNSFDLGSYRSGDQPRSAVLTTPGIVDVYCNIHSRMHATILVVPSATYAKVAADGTFRLDNVPVGARHIVAFSPGAKPVTQKVDVLPAGAQTTFTLEYEGQTAHLNKLGQPYGSYKE